MERAPRPTTFIEKQLKENGIDEKISLWLETVDLSSLSPEAKTGFIKLIETFNQSIYYTMDDWVYGCVNQLITIYEKFKSETETLSVFESIRKELWDFWKEVKDKI